MPEFSDVQSRPRTYSTEAGQVPADDHLAPAPSQQDHLAQHASMLQQVLNLPESDEMVLSMLDNQISGLTAAANAPAAAPTADQMQARNDALDPMAHLATGVPQAPDAQEDELQQRMNVLNGMDQNMEDLQDRSSALDPMARLTTGVPAMPDAPEDALEQRMNVLNGMDLNTEELAARKEALGATQDDDELMQMRAQAIRPQGLSQEDMMVLEDKLLELERMDVPWDYKTAAAHLNYDDHEDMVITQAKALRRGLPPLSPATIQQLEDSSQPEADWDADQKIEALGLLPEHGDPSARERLDALQTDLPDAQAHKAEVEAAEDDALFQEAGLQPPLLRQGSIEIMDDEAAAQKAAQDKQRNDAVAAALSKSAKKGGMNLGMKIAKESRAKKLKRYLTSKNSYADGAKRAVPGYTVAKETQKARKEANRISAGQSMARGTEDNELLQAILACGLYYQRYKRDKALITATAAVPLPGTGPIGSAIKIGAKGVAITTDFWSRYLHAGMGKGQQSYQKKKLTGRSGAKIGDLRDVRNVRALLIAAGSASHNSNTKVVAEALGSNGEDLREREPNQDSKLLNGSQDDYLTFAERNVYQALKDGTLRGDQVPPEMILPILWRMHKLFTTVARYKAEQMAEEDKALAAYDKARVKALAQREKGKHAAIPKISDKARRAQRRQKRQAQAAQADASPMASAANTGPNLSPSNDQTLDPMAPAGGFLAHAKNLDNLPEQHIPEADRRTNTDNDRVDVIQDKKKKKEKKPMLLA